MRKRVDQLGVAQPEIQRSGADEIDVALPDVSNAPRAEAEVGKTAQLFFYDWEPNVIGPNGKPAPTEPTVTGGHQAGAAQFGLPEYQAVLRAAKRPPILRKTDTTWSKGCTPAQLGGCIYGSWYLLEPAHEKGAARRRRSCPAGNRTEPVRRRLQTAGRGQAEGGARQPRHRARAGAPDRKQNSGKVTQKSPNSYYVLNDDPVLTGADITNPQQGFDEGGGGTGAPNVTFGFTSHGKSVFQRVTKEIAHRGQEAQLPGVGKEAAQQHFAVVLDGQLITDAVDRLHQVPRRHRRLDRLADLRRLHDHLRPGPRQRAAVGRAADQARTDLQLAGLGDARQNGAQPGPDRRPRGLRGRVPVPAALLPRARRDRRRRSAHLRRLLLRADQADPDHAHAARDRRLILTIGVAADANIVIFERVKEEIRGGRSIISGIATGYKRGFAAIVDANVVTFMTAFILFALATAEVKGFAFTLGIGTLVSLFTAVLATQAALGTMGRSRLVSHPAALGAARRGRGWTFDFMGASKWFFSLSGTILLIGALAIGGKGLNFGIDFKSGTRIQTAFVKPVSPAEVSAVMTAEGYPNAEVQKYSSKSIGGSGFQISTKTLKPDKVKKVQALLDSRFGNGPSAPGTKNFSSTSIGPTFGKTIANSAVIAIIASLLVISAYIALRFEWKYAVPVLIALMHDLLITAGVYSLTGREVTTSTVAALLTILGYSLYDTIIVFDRVRENVPRMPRAAFSQIVNRSMSEVLTRSLATSFCTLLPVLALLLFGGETLKDFAFALMVGIASGAYSSIFIASPVLTHWKEREGAYRQRRARIVRELGAVPAYATAVGGAPVDVEPERKKRRSRRGGLITEEPGQQISRDEFQELVQDLDVEGEPAARRSGSAQPGAGTGARAGRPATAAPRAARPERDPAADLTPEDLVLKDAPKPRAKRRRPRNRRHGRSR